MTKYRRKPVVVDAKIFSKGMEDGATMEDYLPEEVYNNRYNLIYWKLRDYSSVPEAFTKVELNRKVYPFIKTLEGNHYITEGDYIITGVKGERYPCKPNIFEMTYEKVE